MQYSRTLGVIGMIAIACGMLHSIGCSQSASAKPAAAKPKPSVVVAKPVVMPIVEWDEFVGRLEPVESVQVRSRVSGYLASTNFEEGTLVHRGDILAVVDQRPFLSEVNRSRANLAEAEAQLVQAKALVSQSQADAQRATIHRDLTKKQLDRNSLLVKQNATALQDYEISEAEFAQSEADVVVAKSRIDSALSAVAAAEASVNIAKSNLQLAELNLTYTEIRAPIDGRISQRFVTEGNLVSGGTNDSTLLTTIVSLNPIHCYFDADEKTYLKYTQLSKEGKRPDNREVRNPVYLALSNEHDSYPHKGYIDFIDNRMDELTGTIRGRAILPNDRLELTPGLFARVRLPGSPRYDAILIPDKSIGTDQAEKFVLTVDSQGKVVRKAVTLGPMSHGLRIVRDGIAKDDLVIVSGQQRARPGMDVASTTETVQPGRELLPDDYQPVSPEELLTTKRPTAGNVSLPIGVAPPAGPSFVPNDNSSLTPAPGDSTPSRTARSQP